MPSLNGTDDDGGDTTLGRAHGVDWSDGAFQRSTESHGHDADHHALVYETRSEQFAAVAPFVQHGLDRGERCLYVADDNSTDAVLEALRSRGVDVDDAVDSGALTVTTPAETYRRAGEFDGDEMRDFWRESLADARSDGYTGVRAAAEMTWALDGETDAEQLVEYEALLNPLYEDDRYSVLCQYNRERFPDDVVEDVIETHPLVVHGDTVSDNLYYTPPEELFESEGATERVDRKLRTLRERTASKAALETHERNLEDLYEILSDSDRTFRERLSALLDLGCERFGMEMGGLARVDSESDRFEVEATNGEHPDLVPGSEYPLSETYCQATVDEGGTCAVTDTARFERKLCYEQFGVRAYLGTFLEFDDADDRTLWFVSRRPRDEISAGDKTFHHVVGQWVRYELERRRQTDQFVVLDSLNRTARDINRALAGQSTREEVEQVVCDRLTASEPYAFAWIGTDEQGDIVPTADASARDSQSGVTELGTGGLADRTARTGDPQVLRNVEARRDSEPWRELADERGITGVAAIPIAYESERYGVLVVYATRERAFDEKERDILVQLGEIMGLAITAIDHERALASERERLEFINRLVRHNLLNSLNVVSARSELVGDAVEPEAADHLETIRNRTDEMVGLVEDLRSLMKAVVESEERQLTPVDLGTALGAKVEQARRTFEDAEFVVRGDLSRAGEVLADDLLEEAFENLLVNAVQHNDSAIPRVWLSVEASEDEATVRVADNGPGVDEVLRQRVFEKGHKRFDSPGTGFGLHLVQEIVESYGGTVRVEDRDPEGAVFSVSLPRVPADD